MDAIAQMQGWINKTTTAETELSKLERESKKLSAKSEKMRAERQSLWEQIAEHEQAIIALEAEDAEAKNGVLEAMLSDDVAQERALKQRRKQIATEAQRHETEIHGLRDSLESLEGTEQEAATIAAKLDALDFGYAFGFGSRVRDALVREELQLKGRRSTVKRELPEYSQDVYRQVRVEQDEKYAAKQEHGGMSEVEYENCQKRKAEQERKNKAANSPFVGVSAHGGPRRSEPSEQDFGS